MQFRDTVRPLLIAPAASVGVHVVFATLFQQAGLFGSAFVILMAWVWGLSIAAAVVFVMPVLALIPRLRQPPFWFAAIWGAVVAWVFSGLFLRRVDAGGYSLRAWAGLGVAGAAAGLLYAALVRPKAEGRSTPAR